MTSISNTGGSIFGNFGFGFKQKPEEKAVMKY